MLVTIRPRRLDDVPRLIEILAAQQPETRYPFVWPPAHGAERFVVRADEEAAWVVEANGAVAGHVSVTTVTDDPPGRVWSAGAGRPTRELGCVSVLFVGRSRRGTGLGGRLLSTAVAWCATKNRTPVLDVVPAHGIALAVYRHLGWRDVGEFRPDWLPDGERPVRMMVLPDATARQADLGARTTDVAPH